jgi:histidine triad (HIT) family protein
MDECLFCKIVKGEIPSAQVYATDQVLAFLDIGPVQRGHTLIIPKAHYPDLWQVPKGLGQGLLLAMQVVGQAVMRATKADGLNVFMNNYQAAGQVVPHAHWHLIPRFEGDGLRLWSQQEYESPEDMRSIAKAIQDEL